MRSKKLLKIVLVIAFALAAGREASAQGIAYGFSDVVWDSTSGRVTTTSATWLNYWAGLHYDPAVVGGMYMNYQLLGAYSDWGAGYWSDAVVIIQTNFPSPPDTRFDVLSDHYIVAYFYTDVIILDDEEPWIPREARKPDKQSKPATPGAGRKMKRYYDPMGFSRMGGGSYPGWKDFRGSSNAATLGWEYQFFYLGTTGKGIIANPTTCQGRSGDGLLPPCPSPTPTPTPAPLTVKITNTFRGQEDLSAGTDPYPALFGAGVQLNVLVSPEQPSGQVTFQWSGDFTTESSCAQASVCVAKFAKPNDTQTPFYTVTVQVRRGNETPISKSVKIKVQMPTLTYTGQGKTPFVTTSSVPCVFPAVLGQFLVLGCPNAAPPSAATAGFAVKGVLTAPAGLVSEGGTSWVEFRQILKSEMNRWGPNNLKEVFDFDDPGVNGWREDFNGRDQDVYEAFENAGMLLRGSFTNSAQQASQVTLDLTDSPATRLLPVNDNNLPVNLFKRKEVFKTYITYFTSLDETSEDFGSENRKALGIVEWNWDGLAKRSGSNWALVGDRNPKVNPTFTGTPVPFSQTGTGEAAFSGRFGDPITGIAAGEWIGSSTPPPVTTTTKKSLAVYRPSTGSWYVLLANGTVQAVQFGVSYDIPVPGDYDGDGRSDFAVYRPDNPATPQDECDGSGAGCKWYILRSSDGVWNEYIFGLAEDIPIPADFDGDGKTDISIFRPSSGEWWHIRSSDGVWSVRYLGKTGDIPLPSDYDGDGFDDMAAWKPNGTWIIQRSSDNQLIEQAWGSPGDTPVVGDFDGDGKTDLATFQPYGVWHILRSSDGQTVDAQFGIFGSDIPIPGDFDGDGKSDIAIWRSATPAEWWIWKSSDGTWMVHTFGDPTDIPVPSAYWP